MNKFSSNPKHNLVTLAVLAAILCIVTIVMLCRAPSAAAAGSQVTACELLEDSITATKRVFSGRECSYIVAENRNSREYEIFALDMRTLNDTEGAPSSKSDFTTLQMTAFTPDVTDFNADVDTNGLADELDGSADELDGSADELDGSADDPEETSEDVESEFNDPEETSEDVESEFNDPEDVESIPQVTNRVLHFNPYDVSEPSGMTYEQLAPFVEKYCPEWVGLEDYLLSLDNQVNLVFLLAVARMETWAGSECVGWHNCFNIRYDDGSYVDYGSFTESIQDFIRLITEEYLAPDGLWHEGTSIYAIGLHYAQPEWAPGITDLCYEIAEIMQD